MSASSYQIKTAYRQFINQVIAYHLGRDGVELSVAHGPRFVYHATQGWVCVATDGTLLLLGSNVSQAVDFYTKRAAVYMAKLQRLNDGGPEALAPAVNSEPIGAEALPTNESGEESSDLPDAPETLFSHHSDEEN